MVHLVKIGNSQGIRIPKVIIEQSQIEGKELKLQVVNNGLLVSPRIKARDGWKESINKKLADNKTEQIDHEWLDATLTTDEELDW